MNENHAIKQSRGRHHFIRQSLFFYIITVKEKSYLFSKKQFSGRSTLEHDHFNVLFYLRENVPEDRVE